MEEVYFEGDNPNISRSLRRKENSFFVKTVIALSGGKISTREGANSVLLIVAVTFFVLSGIILILG